MNGPSLTLTLPPAAPAPTWWVAVQNLHTTALTIASNGRTINGRSANITLQPYQEATIYTDGSNYFANPPWVCGDGLRPVVTGTSFTCTVDSAIVASRSTAQSGIDTVCIPRGNSGTTYTCAPATVTGAYTAYSAWRFVPDVNSGVNPSVNMWGLGPLTLKKSLNGTPTNIAANELRAGVSYIMVLGAGTPPSTALILPAEWSGGAGYASNAGAATTDINLIGQCDSRRYVCLHDEFVSGLNESAGIAGELGWSVTGGTVPKPSAPGTFGVIGAQTGASAGSNARFLLSSGNQGAGFAPYNATTFDTLVRSYIDRPTTVSVFLGFVDSSSNPQGEASRNAIGVGYDTTAGDTGWMCVAKNGGAATRTAIMGGRIDTNPHTFRIRSAVPGTILCSMDGGAETSINTNLPTAALNPDISVTTRVDSARAVYVDFLQHVYRINR
jgi:hypothetical protein